MSHMIAAARNAPNVERVRKCDTAACVAFTFGSFVNTSLVCERARECECNIGAALTYKQSACGWNIMNISCTEQLIRS